MAVIIFFKNLLQYLQKMQILYLMIYTSFLVSYFLKEDVQLGFTSH